VHRLTYHTPGGDDGGGTDDDNDACASSMVRSSPSVVDVAL
jgi:hypothetical protein